MYLLEASCWYDEKVALHSLFLCLDPMTIWTFSELIDKSVCKRATRNPCVTVGLHKVQLLCIQKVRKINQNLYLWVARFIIAIRVTVLAIIRILFQMCFLLIALYDVYIVHYTLKYSLKRGWPEQFWVPRMKLGRRPWKRNDKILYSRNLQQ